MYELSKHFSFDAGHTLERAVQTESSLRIHGHSYGGEVTLRGRPDPVSDMIVDVGILERALESMRDALDHRFLDGINDLGAATMEYRDSNSDACSYWGEEVGA